MNSSLKIIRDVRAYSDIEGLGLTFLVVSRGWKIK